MMNLCGVMWLFLALCLVVMMLPGCASKANETYYEEEETYTEECYCKGPPATEVQIEDQR